MHISQDLTKHARSRAQQRAISAVLIDHLFGFGRALPAGDGAELLYFDKGARRRLQNALPKSEFREIESKLDSYAIVNRSGTVSTVGRRCRRIWRR